MEQRKLESSPTTADARNVASGQDAWLRVTSQVRSVQRDHRIAPAAGATRNSYTPPARAPQSIRIDRAALAERLATIGLSSGSHVLVHSSLSQIGYVEGGAETVVNALLDVVGTSGTVIAPTLTGSADLRPESPVTFDVNASPSWTGAVAETVRKWPGAVRSLHATHSVAAIGAAAPYITGGHLDTLTPCGRDSPYARLANMENGVILLLGCDHESNTTLHYVEELLGSNYHLYPKLATATIRTGDVEFARRFFLHRYGTARSFSRIEPLLRERNLQAQGIVGQAAARLMSATDLVSLATDALRAAPNFFISDIPAQERAI